jgi:hypothetical protein
MTIWKPVTLPGQLVGRLETSSFDFKREYALLDPSTAGEMAKDVAAFASGFGGTILVGVEHKGGSVTSLPGVPDPQALIEALRKAIAAYCVPWPPYSEEAIAIDASAAEAIMRIAPSTPYPDRVVLAINVDADPRGPIGVRPNGGKGSP